MGLINSALERVKLKMLTRNEYESQELRDWFAKDFRVEVGMYSYGCFDRWRIPGRTRIGRYCSFAKSVRVLDANHPFDALSTHPFLYERKFGVVDKDLIDPEWIVIEDDVWISHNATITPSCKRIGRGAIIGANAVVTKDVPPYAIVAGVPATLIRYRFNAEMQAAIEASRWWEMDKAALAEVMRRDPDLLLKPTVAKLAELSALQGR